jgi:hypothetical protein
MGLENPRRFELLIIVLPAPAIEWVAVLLRIQEVPASYIYKGEGGTFEQNLENIFSSV